MQSNEFETALDRDGNGAVILKYKGNDLCLLVPTRINGRPVTAIAAGAFEGCRIESIELPETLHRLEAGAFARCEELVEVAIPGSASEMDNCLQFDCASLKTVVVAGDTISPACLSALANLNGVGIMQHYKAGGVDAFIEMQFRTFSA